MGRPPLPEPRTPLPAARTGRPDGPARLSALHTSVETVGDDILITARFKEW